jgi:CheY-like chemotaxis protein
MDQAAAKTKPKVLLVDDDSRTTRLLGHMLREDGFDVEFAWDGAAAIARLTRGPVPDILVTDLLMPHVDGIAVTAYARSREPLIPIFIVTGHPNLLGSAGCATLDPAPVVMTKPLDYEKFAGELRRAAAGLAS